MKKLKPKDYEGSTEETTTANNINKDELVKEISIPATSIGIIGLITNCSIGPATLYYSL